MNKIASNGNNLEHKKRVRTIVLSSLFLNFFSNKVQYFNTDFN
jgi:hypothetical protein